MRVLYFSPRDCWPADTGARLRDFYLARELARGGARVTYLGFMRAGTDAPGPILRERFALLCDSDVILVRRAASYSIPKLVRGFLGPAPISILNYLSPIMESELQRLLAANDFDVVQIEGVHLSGYVAVIRKIRPAVRLICDWHNIESELMARYGENTANPARRVYVRRTVKLLRGLEDRLLLEADVNTVCSERERQILLGRGPRARIEVVGNGVDTDYYAVYTGAEPRRSVVFVGSMDYHANIDAAVYFAREAWPRLRARRPELEFVIVGSRPAAEVVALREEPGITVTGTVESVRPYYAGALAVVAPLRVGSGTRLKVLEAMAAGTPVVSTSAGIEGLELTPGEDVLVADSPAAMADEIASLEAGSERWRALAANGRGVVAARYDWRIVGEALRRVYAEGRTSEVGSEEPEARSEKSE